MKISVPYIVWEAQRELIKVLAIIFRNHPENNTYLDETFTPRKIETRRVPSTGDESYEEHIRMWANGVYITAIASGWERYEMEVSYLQFRVRRHNCRGWAEFKIFVGGGNSFLVAEHYPNARSAQLRKLQEIYELLK